MPDQEITEVVPVESSPRGVVATLPLGVPAAGINGNPHAGEMIATLAKNLSNNRSVKDFQLSVNNATGAVNVAATGVNGTVATISNPTPGLVMATVYTPTTIEARDAAIDVLRDPPTQTDAATILGIDQSTVSRVENNPK